jgi:hypothetical protein
MSYQCKTCGREHEGLPAMGADRPDHWWEIPEHERDRRIKLTEDTCAIDDEHFFIRGVLEIPLTDHDGTFDFGV